MEPRVGPLEGRWIRINGSSMHYLASPGPLKSKCLPVILVHGLAASHRYMVPLAKQLAFDFQVYAPDLPGFGKSAKPRQALDFSELADALAAWMTALRLERAHLVGNSLGCNILVEFALRHGERVERLVLQGPTADPRRRTALRQIARWLINGWREPSMGGILFKDYAAAGLRRAFVTFRHMLHHRIEDKLPYVRAPTLVVRGTRDPLVPREWAQQVAHLLPKGRLVEIPGAAHTLNFFAPKKLARLLRPFLKAAANRRIAP